MIGRASRSAAAKHAAVGPVEGRLTNSWEPAYAKEHQFTRQETTNTVTAAFDELDFEYATSVAEKAMRSMAEQRVPPTPNNFHVWFNYTLGAPPVLKRAIDILIGNKRKFDAHTNREIYDSYVGSKASDEAVAYEVSQQLHSVMASAKQFLTTAIADNRTQMAAINDVTERTEAGVDPKLLIESLMSELAKATTRATKLEVSFVEKSRELATIRDSLIKSEERAKTDTLTGLPNRRALEEFFRKAQLAAMEQDDPAQRPADRYRSLQALQRRVRPRRRRPGAAPDGEGVARGACGTSICRRDMAARS